MSSDGDENMTFAEWAQNEYPDKPYSDYVATLMDAGVSGDTVLNTANDKLEAEFRDCGLPRFPARDIVIAAKAFFENQRRVRQVPMAVFWDVSSVRPPPPQQSTGREVIQKLRAALSSYGPIAFMNAYMNTHDDVAESQRSDFQLCGVSLRLLGSTRESMVESLAVDVMRFVLDKHPNQVSVCIVSDPTSFEYLRSTLRSFGVVAVLVTPRSMTATAKVTHPPFMRWETDVLKLPSRQANPRSVPLTPATHTASSIARFNSHPEIGTPLYADPTALQPRVSARRPWDNVHDTNENDALHTLIAASAVGEGAPSSAQGATLPVPALQALVEAGMGSRTGTALLLTPPSAATADVSAIDDDGDEILGHLATEGGEPLSEKDQADDDLWTLRQIMERLRDEGNLTPLRSLVGIKLKECNPTAFKTREQRKQVIDRACESFCEEIPTQLSGHEKIRLRANGDVAALERWETDATMESVARPAAGLENTTAARDLATTILSNTGLYGKANAKACKMPFAVSFPRSIAPLDARLPQEFAYVCTSRECYFILFTSPERRDEYLRTRVAGNPDLAWLQGKYFLWDVRQPRLA